MSNKHLNKVEKTRKKLRVEALEVHKLLKRLKKKLEIAGNNTYRDSVKVASSDYPLSQTLFVESRCFMDTTYGVDSAISDLGDFINGTEAVRSE